STGGLDKTLSGRYGERFLPQGLVGNRRRSAPEAAYIRLDRIATTSVRAEGFVGNGRRSVPEGDYIRLDRIATASVPYLGSRRDFHSLIALIASGH
ncbi:MAG: hypothetical protein V3U73_10825, partial [bacterium]